MLNYSWAVNSVFFGVCDLQGGKIITVWYNRIHKKVIGFLPTLPVGQKCKRINKRQQTEIIMQKMLDPLTNLS